MEIPIISNSRRNYFNIHYRKCKQNKTPFVVVLKKQKYAEIEYDLFPVDFNLTEDCQNKIRNLWIKFGDEYPESFKNKRNVNCAVGRNYGIIPGIELSKAVELSQQIATIINDKENQIDVVTDYLNNQ